LVESSYVDGLLARTLTGDLFGQLRSYVRPFAAVSGPLALMRSDSLGP
jgi:hypothetical protein